MKEIKYLQKLILYEFYFDFSLTLLLNVTLTSYFYVVKT